MTLAFLLCFISPLVFAQPVWQDQTSNTGSGTSWTVNFPANISAGNLIIVTLTTQKSASTDVTSFSVTSTGFTKLEHEHFASTNSAPEVVVFYKIATGIETGSISGTVIEYTDGARWKAVAARVTDFDSGSPFGSVTTANSGNSTVNNLTLPSITRTAQYTLLISARSARGSVSSATTPAGMTQLYLDDGNSSDGDNRRCNFLVASQSYTNTGTTGTKTFTWSSNAKATGLMFIIRGCLPMGTLSFAMGSTSTRCAQAETITYTASATNATSLTYSLDASSLTAGNTINSSTGAVTFVGSWSGTSTITATAEGCNGTTTTTHVVTTNVFEAYYLYGSSSQRCQENESRSYAVYTENADSVLYELDAQSLLDGLSINAYIGSVVFPLSYTGTATITATAYGCGTTITNSHEVITDNLVVVDDYDNVQQGDTAYVSILDNDDCDLDTSSLVVFTAPTQGTASIDLNTGILTYIPSSSFSGTDSLTYQICRLTVPSTCETAKLYFNVIPNLVDDYFNKQNSNCQKILNDVSELDIEEKYQTVETVTLYSNPLVADLDGDGDQEIIIMSGNDLSTASPRSSKDIHIFDGATGAFQYTITTPYMSWEGPTPICLADLDKDGDVEIIIASLYSRNAAADQKYLYCYSHTGTLLWKSDTQYGVNVTNGSASGLGLADFNQDGSPEVYVYNEIYNARTGVKLCNGGANGTGNNRTKNTVEVALTVAADLRPATGLELACGRTVYEVNITNTTGTSGNTMTAYNISTSSTKDGFTALADMDLDGNLDVIVMPNDAQLYIWNPRTLTTIASYNSGSGERGTLFIGDVNGDGSPNIGYCRPNAVDMVAYNGTSTLSLLWTLTTTDASGRTGLTMFDFNQDGTQELIYRDESLLRILDGSGSSAVTINSFAATSTTGVEGPIVADIDNDGEAEILVTSDGATVDGDYVGLLVVFESINNDWAPARKVWNQFGYYNVHIKDDYTVPKVQADHGDAFFVSGEDCPDSFKSRPLNAFNVQSTFYSDAGCPVAYLPDVEILIESISYSSTTQILNVNYSVLNLSDKVTAPAGIAIDFYLNNPLRTSATLKLSTTTSEEIAPYSRTTSTSVQMTGISDFSELYALVNGDNAASTPFQYPLSAVEECNYSNNAVSFQAYEGSPLPIELFQFDAYREKDFVRVYWSTSSEFNTHYYWVQRSEDGINFTNLERVEAQGYSQNTTHYSILDEKPLPGLSYYRLYQIDLDGQYSITDPVAVLFEAEEIQVFPNPTEGIVHVFNPSDAGTMQLVSLEGTVVFETTMDKGDTVLDLATYPSGMYLLQIQWEDKPAISKRIVKR